MNFIEKLNNIYVIDTNMWGFEHYNSAYIVEGKEIALIDTGEQAQLEVVRSAIKAHGFSISDISYIFVTHCEHIDHSGNVAPLLREAPRANVYIHPLGHQYLTNPESLNLKSRMSPQLIAKRVHTTMEAVPASRIRHLRDGELFDLGNGEKLKVIFAPGHQPSGIVITEEKNNGLFVNDLVGVCYPEADIQYPPHPLGSDNIQCVESLKKLMKLTLDYLYLGHYGISNEPEKILGKGLQNVQKLLDIGIKYMREGKPELIASKALETVLMPELEKLKSIRKELYDYETQEHAPFQLQLFAKWCQERLKI